jgi:hypothetical protein
VSDYAALEQFLGGYLNEDWPEAYADPWLAVDDFVRSQHSFAVRLRTDIDDLIRYCPSEDGLQARLIRLGLGYRIHVDEWASHRQWLLAVADHVDEILRKSPAA